MKTISPELKAHLAAECTTTALCWKIVRRDGAVLGFTDHDGDITFGGVTYAAATGFTGTAIRSSGNLAVDNLDVTALFDATGITAADIEAGKYDYAEVFLFLINWADPSQGILKLQRGRLGEVQIRRGMFVAELRSLSQSLQQTIVELSSPTCRADLGDVRCKVDVDALAVSGGATSVIDRANFADSSRAEAAGYFTGGLLTWTAGLNAGYAMEVKKYSEGGVFQLTQPMPYAIAENDAYTVYPGCDKVLGTCRDKFSNVINFRGEPFIPGIDKLMEHA